MKSQVLHTVWCNISGQAAGEIWHWSLLGVKGLQCALFLVAAITRATWTWEMMLSCNRLRTRFQRMERTKRLEETERFEGFLPSNSRKTFDSDFSLAVFRIVSRWRASRLRYQTSGSCGRSWLDGSGSLLGSMLALVTSWRTTQPTYQTCPPRRITERLARKRSRTGLR